MASGGMDTPFVWGQGGQKKTPQQVERDRLLAAALMREGSQYTPLGSWTQGLARLANGIVGGLESRWADEAEQAGMEGARAAFDPVIAALTGGGSSYSAGASPVSSYAPSGAVDTGASSPMASFNGNQQEFINALAPAAIQVGREIGVDPRIIIAQAAQETGWGQSAPGNNFFGIKSHGQGGGQTLNTHEYVNGKRVNVSDSFRTFESPEDSVRGYGDFITRNPRYEPFRTAQGLDAQLEALQASGYATDPNYSRSVGSIARGITLPEYTPTENAYAGTGMRDLRDRGVPEGFNPADALVAPEVMRSSVPSSVPPEDLLLSPEVMTGRMAYAPQGDGISNADLMGGTALEAIDQVAPQGADPMAMALQPQQAPMQVAQAGGGGNDLLAAVLAAQSDPWAQQQYGGTLNSLLSNELNRINQANDPMRQMQLEREALELEALRNPWSAQPATPEQLAPWGITPNPGESWTFGQDGLPQQVFAPASPDYGFTFAPDGTLIRTDTTSGTFDPMGQFGGGMTDTQRNLEWRAQQAGLIPGTPDYQRFILEGSGPQTIVNVGGEGEVGTIPPGYELFTDPETNARSMRPIEGGPVWAEQQAAAQQAESAAQARADQEARYGNVVVEDIDRAVDVIEGAPWFTTGILGQWTSGVGGTPANRLNNLLNTVKANAGFDRLQAMRDSSPTGGALGQVSNIELGLLQSAIGSLEQANNADDLVYNLRRVQQIYSDIIHGPGNTPITENPGIQPDGSATPTGSQPYTEGTIIENDVGQRMIMRNGKWEMI